VTIGRGKGRALMSFALAAALSVLGAGFFAAPVSAWSSAPATASSGETPSTAVVATDGRRAVTVRQAVKKPKIHRMLIPFPIKRKHQMSRYSKRHYGKRGWRLEDPKTIVEHYSVTGSVRAIYNTFAPDHPDLEFGELPNVCSHFAVSPTGHIYQFVPLGTRCRHTVGLNDVAIGIEHVGYSDRDVMGNRLERKASIKLTWWLRCRFDIPIKYVIGHNESLDSPFHHELVPSLKFQTHGDMRHATMVKYRKALRAKGQCRTER